MLAIIGFILGIIAFLLMEHPIAFWCVFVPLVIVFIIAVVNFLTGRRGHIGNLLMVLVVFLAMIVAIVVVATPEPCEHEVITRYVFTSYDNMENEHSTICDYCKKCDDRLTRHERFQGELVDKSYLSAIIEHSDDGEIVPGEYYTVTVTVPLGFYGYTSDTVWLTCEVKNADFIVRFSVEFREEFKELVEAVEKGEEITFRGRFYDKGCGFTDSELICYEP